MSKVVSAVIALVALSIGLSPAASADDATFIGGVSYYLPGMYLDPSKTAALIADGRKVCEMSDAGFAYEAMEFIRSKWRPTDAYGFMGAATAAYCPLHSSDWAGV